MRRLAGASLAILMPGCPGDDGTATGGDDSGGDATTDASTGSVDGTTTGSPGSTATTSDDVPGTDDTGPAQMGGCGVDPGFFSGGAPGLHAGTRGHDAGSDDATRRGARLHAGAG